MFSGMFLAINFIPEFHAFARPRSESRTHAHDGAAPSDGRRPRTCTSPRTGDTRNSIASRHKRAHVVAPPRCSNNSRFCYPPRSTVHTMPESNTTNTDSDKPSWDSSQFTQRAWIDDLLPWLPTCNAAYATLIEHGYTLTPQGCVFVHSYAHAQAVFFNQYTPYPLDSPSP
eukprot:6171955-Pleurochrysis_carterae.AAC.1